MFFKKEEEIRDLWFLIKNEFFVRPAEKTSIKIGNESYNRVIADRFLFNNDNIYDKEIDDYITLRDMLLLPQGYGYFEKSQFEEAEYIASKYNLKLNKGQKRVVDDYDDYLGSVELDHHEDIYEFVA